LRPLYKQKKSFSSSEESSDEELFLYCKSGLNLLPVAKGHVDIFFTIDCNEVRQGVKCVKGELDQFFWHLLKSSEEMLHAGLLALVSIRFAPSALRFGP
jgi:hypothetical protein